MKKNIFVLLVLILFPFNIFAEKSITVSAIVGSINHTPNIIITSPSELNNPWELEYVQNWTSVAIDFWITDDESDDVYYTISASKWVVSNDNWWPISSFPSIDNVKKKQFHYLAPFWIYWENTITITANDWVSVSVKELKIYIY